MVSELLTIENVKCFIKHLAFVGSSVTDGLGLNLYWVNVYLLSIYKPFFLRPDSRYGCSCTLQCTSNTGTPVHCYVHHTQVLLYIAMFNIHISAENLPRNCGKILV